MSIIMILDIVLFFVTLSPLAANPQGTNVENILESLVEIEAPKSTDNQSQSIEIQHNATSVDVQIRLTASHALNNLNRRRRGFGGSCKRSANSGRKSQTQMLKLSWNFGGKLTSKRQFGAFGQQTSCGFGGYSCSSYSSFCEYGHFCGCGSGYGCGCGCGCGCCSGFSSSSCSSVSTCGYGGWGKKRKAIASGKSRQIRFFGGCCQPCCGWSSCGACSCCCTCSCRYSCACCSGCTNFASPIGVGWGWGGRMLVQRRIKRCIGDFKKRPLSKVIGA